MLTANEGQKTRTLSEQEIEQLFLENYDLVYAAAKSVTDNKHDAEDIVQVLFLKFLQQKSWPEVTANFKGYLYRVAVNEARTMIRSRKCLKEDDVFKDLDLELPLPGPDAADDDGEREKLWNAIARLKPDVAAVLLLHYEHSYSDEEIAEMRGESRGKIAMMLNRARTKLQEIIAGGV
jgi:RNA polymerase sigma factor (sigma-70 family)